MPKPTKFDGMMHQYCAGMGFCGSSIDGRFAHVTDFIPNEGQVSAEDFAEWILKAEGLYPDYNKWTPKLIKVFVKHMGSNSVDASILR